MRGAIWGAAEANNSQLCPWLTLYVVAFNHYGWLIHGIETLVVVNIVDIEDRAAS